MCVICRTRFQKEELNRYVCPGESAADGLIPDPGRNKPGRGFYVCGEPACRDKFGKAAPGLMKKCKGVRT
ncbi:YlxR family protein [Salidesulfovibrio brasiliensis]|uniref:YlxR family protein n=1 Tax=Salidesulfovibrio brasiliensis TaxID=221711 RepID=UPI0034E1B36D